MKKKTISYRNAVHWLHNSYVLCNNITIADESILENLQWDDNEQEIFQFFLSDASKSEVEYLENHFNLIFAYSNLLDLYILCVPFWGTSWDDYEIETDNYDDLPF